MRSSSNLVEIERHVRNAHDLPPIDINDLLVEQVASDAKHVLIAMVRGQLFIAKPEPFQVDAVHLVIANGQPSRPAAQQKSVDTNGVNAGH